MILRVKLVVAGLLLAAVAAFGQTEVGPLPNFHTVDPGVYRGGAPTPAGLKQLKAMGVKTVVDLRISPKQVRLEAAAVRALGMTPVNLPMGGDPPTGREVATIMSLLNQAGPQNPVFVHCQHGADRTGCMLGIYRIRHDHWSYSRAYSEMLQYGFKRYYTKLADAVQKFGFSSN
ncbi:MAG: fused DSP-PTPase phosphatase/NAD kinase-like protein [Capsulimonadaceae bacterium]